MQQYIWYLLPITAVLAIAAALAGGKQRQMLLKASLFFGSLVVLVFIASVIAGTGRAASVSAGVAADKVEIQLRLHRAIEIGMDEVAIRLGATPADRRKAETIFGDQDEPLRNARDALAAAVLSDKTNVANQAKLAVVLYELQKMRPAKPPPRRRTPGDPPPELPPELSSAPAIAAGLSRSEEQSTRRLGEALAVVFSGKRPDRPTMEAAAASIEEQLPYGWYKDTVLERLFRQSRAEARLKQLLQHRRDVYVRMFIAALALFSIIFVSALIGILVILVQLALMSRRAKPPPPDPVGLDVKLSTVYAVFIAWFCTQAFISLLLQHLVRAGFRPGPDMLSVALATAATYLLANLPGLLYIWLFAIRPRSWGFFQALKIRLRTSTAGPWQLVAYGYLGWCATFPVVIAAAWIVNQLTGTQSSDNPVLSQIMSAARAPDPLVILTFYLTIGVLAPVAEEVMFRGFIMGSLRQRIGVPLSILASSAIFALVHFDKGGLIGLLAIGLVLGCLFEKTRSLVPCMITHGLWNSCMFTMTLVLFGIR